MQILILFILVPIIILVGIIVLLVILLTNSGNKNEQKIIENNNVNQNYNYDANSYENKFPYLLNNPVLSNKERKFFESLKPIAENANIYVFPKMRMADIITIPKNTENYMKWFNYIKAKHIDFIICDQEMNIKLLIEVDDYTHQYEKRKKRDEFVDKIFNQLNIPILHIYKWTDDELKQQIEEKLGIKKESTA